ncbi:MAG: prephenate dehydratase [Bryobacterales bacterium]|nr:prephenate dehydratase [Bryobacterales bacterium]
MAAKQLLGERAKVVPCERFEQVFRSLADGDVDAAVVPIENTLHGSVHENYDHLLNFDLPITAETSVRIIHNLISIPGTGWKNIHKVYSHPVALNQCLNFFAANPRFARTPFYDTAGSVKMVMAEGLKDAGAIASAMAAEIYGARILKRSIEDDRQNFTRFFLLQRAGEKALLGAGAERKTSLVFSTRNTPGSLFRALSALALRDLNLTKIESRPLRGKPWEYLFYVDVIADLEDTRMRKALGHLEEVADFLKVLGCYSRGK